jgi:AAA domain
MKTKIVIKPIQRGFGMYSLKLEAQVLITFVSVEIRNFRNIGLIELDFKSPNHEHITVISSRRGAGKSNLVTAIKWVLLGESAFPAGFRNLHEQIFPRTKSQSVSGTQLASVVLIVEAGKEDCNKRYRLVRNLMAHSHQQRNVPEGIESLEIYEETSAGLEMVKFPQRFLNEELLDGFNPDLQFIKGIDSLSSWFSGSVVNGQIYWVNEIARILIDNKVEYSQFERVVNFTYNRIMATGQGSQMPDTLDLPQIHVSEEGQIYLRTTKGLQVPDGALTAGARAIVRISILFSLNKLAGDKFPLVIDDLLGLFDRETATSVVAALGFLKLQTILVLDEEHVRYLPQALGGDIGRHYILRTDFSNCAFVDL